MSCTPSSGQARPAILHGRREHAEADARPWRAAHDRRDHLDEYRERIEKDPAFERRFQQVFVDEPSVEDTIAILRGLRERYEAHHKVAINDAALVAAAVLSDRYLTGSPAGQGDRPGR